MISALAAGILVLASPSHAAATAALRETDSLRPLISVLAETPHLRAALSGQADALPWKTDDLAKFLSVENAARPNKDTYDDEVRRLTLAMLVQPERLERHGAELDSV